MITQNSLQHIKDKIIITATFTSEPIGDFLSYWLEEIKLPYTIEFAPYNQVFQELLNPKSLLANNQNGVNVVLVRFEDWGINKNRLQLKVDDDLKAQIFGDRLRHTLPNHLEIAHLNQYETEYLYQEIFGDRVYLKHGIVFNEDDCIIDVGANIGLFTLFAQQKSPQGTIYAFEPAPHAFDKLQTNAKLYCKNTHLFNCGLGGKRTEETFTFYPRSSVFSSFAADTDQDEKAIRSVIINMLQRDDSLDQESLERLADEFLKDRLERETYQAQLRTLSEIIEEYNIQKIDLLKLDAEKSELAILQGIKDDHWSLIKQIVMEVHDQEGSTLKQVMGLLAEKGFQFVVDEESLLHGSGLFNIYATRLDQKHNPVSDDLGTNVTQIEQTVRDFGSALKTAIRQSSPNPYVVCICPPSPTNDTATNSLYQEMEELLAADLKNVSGMYLLKSQELTSIYPVEDYYDPYGDELGHIPYTPTFFCALGTMLARKLYALKSSPHKVIALDCDNTLWSGICGEDGVAGVKIDPDYRALQEFIVEQQAAGKLICLCSKNQEEDVFAVFDQHQDMVLQRHHLVNWRINWQSKSDNLQSLAAELQLSLDSFIFIDDNPVECAEVRANCPEILTLQLPEARDRIPQFLAHIWAFDQLQTTAEDQQRTNLYQQNIQRQHLQQDSLSFTDFLAQLDLEIEISPMHTEQLARVAQLTQRTNQFNLTTIRRSEAEIQQLCDSGKLESLVVKVKDRFGDYGLVGLLLFATAKNALCVDTFLLSCRVLGRGVEHKMLAYLGNLAQERGLGRVELLYIPTQKNQPAQDFLTSIGKESQQERDGGWLFELTAQTASESNFLPLLAKKLDGNSGTDTVNNHSAESLEPVSSWEFWELMARHFYSPELILKEITSRQQRQRPQLETEFVAPRSSIEKAIAHLFAEILKLDRVGIEDNFFELGGDSIQGAILINQLQAQLNEIIHFVVLFDTKTIAGLAAYIEKNYPQAAAKLLGQQISSNSASPQKRIDEAKVLQMRSLIPPFASPIDEDAIKNPPAIFILSPHRSGSTLLRVILGGNPQLFAPPELELLTFNTLGERKAAFSGRYSFWMEGTIRTIMEIRGCSAEEAIALMAELETKNLTTKQFYQLIQQWLGDRILVDKTPSYSIDLATLKRAERNFQNPLYIHLVRHPYATMRSYEQARVEQTFPYQHPFHRRELAELVWLISHENILEFLQQVPQERQYQVKFEDIVSQPQTSVEGLCQFLGLEFHPDMLQPYKEKKQRMTDGIYAQSRMVGDVKFHEHQGINPSTADSWKQDYNTDFLGDVTWRVAESLGYPRNNHGIPAIRRGNPTETQTFPVSFAQQRLWVLAQLEPDSPFYNMFKAVRLHGAVEIEILERSLNEIIRRQEALRTTFSVVEETPVQVIAPHAHIKLSVVNLQGWSEPEQSEQLQLLATQDQLQPFDLTQGLLLRVTLVQLKSESSALLFTMHHIIGDGWSMGVLVQELFSLYRGLLVGDASPLPDLPIQYADFTIWQRQWLRGKALETQINYWQQQLADAPPLLELPTDRPRPAVQTFRGGCFSFGLDTKLTASLQELSHKSGTTLFMTLMAAYATLLSRYSGQSDILLGTPIASRNHQELEGLIGFFVNTLVMRTRLEANPSFSDLLIQVRSVCMDAYANQEVPFEQIVEALQIERSLSHSPLFQVMFALQNTPMEQLQTPELAISPLNLDNVNAKFDLTLQMWETNTEQGNSLEGFWQYNTDLFDQERIARMTGHFQTLLAGIVANPQAAVGTLPFLTEGERHQLLVEWNDTHIPYPDTQSIHELFEEQVEKTPDAVAVVYEDESLTYRELNERANQLAHYLQTLGVKTEVLVGICVERSLAMIIGMLAILKAGGAYVPLDSSYPQERLAYMLNDSQVSILLTQAQLGTQIPPTNAKIVFLDTAWEKVISKYSQQNLINQTLSHNLAYVIYTSGSTGKPKGITVTHQAVHRLVCNTNYVNLTANHRVAQASNAAFDAATFEIWGALLNGARLVGITQEVLLSPPKLATQLQDQQIDFLFVTTALFNQLVNQVPGIFKTLHTVLFGGEAVEPNWVRTLLENQPPQRLLHVYGPTENTTFSSWYLVEQVPAGATNLPIGQPIANTQIYILDRHLQPLPIGVPGELCIGGDGLARGYLNRPDLTEDKFIPNSIPEAQLTSSKKLYKTGDLARYLPDGNIEFISRIDNQVKIRGFRIELAEIEVILTQHPQVRDVVVIAREDKPGMKNLAAYVIPEGKQPLSSELRSFLKEKLPDYMVPASFTVLEALPMTPNGKVDRRALPVPEFEFNHSTGFVSPRTHAEKILVKIWQDVLRLKQVCIHNNFFELGGDSIIGIQIVARANQAGLKLTPKQLFQHQTIAELAAVAVTTTSKKAEQGLVKGIVPLTPIQHWFFAQNLAELHHFNQSVLLEVPPNIQPELLEQALQKLLYHHDALRLRFVQPAGQWQQYNSDLCDGILLAIADLSHLAQTEQSKAIELKADQIQRSLNLADSPLLRVVLFNCGKSSPGRLLIVIHHLAVDGISWRILLEDLSQAYKQLDSGNNIQLPAKTTSFQDWAIRLQNYADAQELHSELDYWLHSNSLAHAPLPLDSLAVASANTVGSSRIVSVSLSVEQTRALLQDVPGAYNTQINDVLLTALVQSFAGWTGDDSLLISLEGHGREDLFEDVDLSRTVGWFTSLFPVCLKLAGLHHPGEALKSVKEQLRCIPNRGIGYGLLRYLSRDAAINKQLELLPQAQVSFNYLGQFDQTHLAPLGWKYAQESGGSIHSPQGQRRHLLNVNGLVMDGRLQLEWKYSEAFHHQDTVENLANNYVKTLETIIDHCLSSEAGGYTPSDFPEIGLSQEALDELLTEIG
ncbi:non-ribosomal peptide synthetase [Nodularia sp. NIES-3585]|uniref:non-ribosomal peptide synthetase n=1 Tax=Nodularia sp. NIES-3585 TaxID=1973477 RepID=UPI000B5CEEBA|nr:non-ribosomal peptide synthetase [Nodularia sp. NIES-3585]GAX34041.1 peptide synthetase [Nodularia sp. NIES-3585]